MSLRGKYVVCVGATSGIGKGVAIKLAQMEANVTVVGRNPALGEEVLSELVNANPKGDHSIVLVDASSMKSIVKGCDEYLTKNEGKPLHYLVQSQGIFTNAGRIETSEAPRMKDTALLSENNDVRSPSILSGGKHRPYTNLDDLDLKKNFSLANAASAAGYYNDLAIDQMSRDDKYLGVARTDSTRGISYIHAAPGFVQSAGGKDLPWYFLGVLKFFQQFAKSPEKCATYMVEGGLVAPQRQGQGFHVMSETGGVAKVTDLHNDRHREAVWKHTNELIDSALEA